MIRAAFAHLVRAVAGALARWARKIDKNPSRVLLEAMQKVAPRCIGFSHSFAGSAGRVIESGTRCACGALIYGEDSGDITHIEAHSMFIAPRDIARCIGSHMWLDGLDEEGWRIIANCLPALMREDYRRTHAVKETQVVFVDEAGGVHYER